MCSPAIARDPMPARRPSGVRRRRQSRPQGSARAFSLTVFPELPILALLALTSGCHREQPKTLPRTQTVPPAAPVAWLKGQTHLHSNRSGDSNTPPEEVVRYYAEHGYDFIVFTDHNRVTRLPDAGSLLVIPGVELTQNLAECEPPDPEVAGCNLHINALFVGPQAPLAVQWPAAIGPTRLAVYTSELGLVRTYGALAQLNHPNFRWAADAAVVTELARRGVRFMEIENGSGDCNDAGDQRHPATEVLWDQALTAGQQLFAVATDDAHHYYDADSVRRRGEPAYTGDRGFVMVHAARSPEAIRAALVSGDFYASTGVRLARLEQKSAALELEVSAETPGECEVSFIGSGGRELARTRGRSARFATAGMTSAYVRAVVRDAAGHRAWIQPLRPGWAP